MYLPCLSRYFDVCGIVLDEVRERPDTHQSPFEQSCANEGCGDAEHYIDNIVMRCIHCRKPYAESHDTESYRPALGCAAEQCVDKCYESISAMQRRYCSENIAVTRIEGVEYAQACHLVEASEARHIAGCTLYCLETVQCDIPWRCRRVEVIYAKIRAG